MTSNESTHCTGGPVGGNTKPEKEIQTSQRDVSARRTRVSGTPGPTSAQVATPVREPYHAP